MKTKVLTLISVMLFVGVAFGQVNNIPTFINEEPIIVVKFFPASFDYLKIGDGLRKGGCYLRVEEKQLLFNFPLFNDVAKTYTTLSGESSNFFLQNNLLTIESKNVEHYNSMETYIIVLELSNKDLKTFKEFMKKIPIKN